MSPPHGRPKEGSLPPGGKARSAKGAHHTSRDVVLLTGAAGQLGHELSTALAPHVELQPRTRAELDIGDPDSLMSAVRALRPSIIVNAAAYTAVDRAESESALAYAINARAPALLADEARRIGAVLIHYSTDYVFDGEAQAPYVEEAPTAPINVYGASKRAGEEAILASGASALIFRTSWVYATHGSNFFLTIRRLAAEQDELRIVADQFGTPNWARTLAEATARVVGMGADALREHSGIYHLSSAGNTSWFEFARAIVGEVVKPQVVPITTAQFPRPARRPSYAVLATGKFNAAFGFELPAWRDELERCRESLSE